MRAADAGRAPRFSDRVAELMQSVEYRCASSLKDRDIVFQTRNAARLRRNPFQPRRDHRFYEGEHDHLRDAWSTMTYIDGAFAGTCRVHVASSKDAVLPSSTTIAKLLIPSLREGRVIVEVSHTAACLEASETYPELPYLVLRPAWLAAEHFNADVVFTAVPQNHTAFYQRVFGFVELSEPRDHPRVASETVCLALDFCEAKPRVEARYPFFRSTRAEREALFRLAAHYGLGEFDAGGSAPPRKLLAVAYSVSAPGSQRSTAKEPINSPTPK